jgi:hypothetical protein
MNKYILYCQESKQSLAKATLLCRNVFVIKGKKDVLAKLHDDLSFNKNFFFRYSIIDPNGAVISTNLRLSKVILEKGQLTINTYDASGSIL